MCIIWILLLCLLLLMEKFHLSFFFCLFSFSFELDLLNIPWWSTFLICAFAVWPDQFTINSSLCKVTSWQLPQLQAKVSRVAAAPILGTELPTDISKVNLASCPKMTLFIERCGTSWALLRAHAFTSWKCRGVSCPCGKPLTSGRWRVLD